VQLIRRLLLLGCVLVLVLFTVFSCRSSWKASEYDRNRRETVGVVTDTSSKTVTNGKGGSRTVHIVNFQFSDESGQEYSGSVGVSIDQFRELSPGSNVRVIYQAHAPASKHWIYSDAEHRDNLGGVWRGAIVGALLMLGFCGFHDWRIRRERALARIAIATHGTVNDVRVLHGSRGPRGWRIDFDFADTEGRSRIGYSDAPVTMEAQVPAKGASVVVLYNELRPKRNGLLATLRYVDKVSLYEDKTDQV
jgi:hypothetical protein